MREHALRRRESISAWVRRRGVDIGEIVSTGASLIYAWRTIEMHDGLPVAPLTSQFFNLSQGFWFDLLLLNASAVSAALLVGWVTGNTFRIRSYVSIASSCVWVVIAIAAKKTGMADSVAAGYFFTCGISWLTALILALKAKYAETRTELEKGVECGRTLAV